MKLIFWTLIFCAGFATGIFMTTPMAVQADSPEQVNVNSAAMISPETVQMINIGMRKCIDVSKEAAVGAGEYIQNKFKERDIEG